VEKPPKKLLEPVSDVIRLKPYSYKTEKSSMLIGQDPTLYFMIKVILKKWVEENELYCNDGMALLYH